MTTSTTTPRIAYTADGSTASFTFNFEIADSSSIAVYEGSTKKTLTTHYSVNFDSGTSGTGAIVFVSAPSASTTVTLVRDTNLARTTDFTQSGAFLANTVNAELDRLSQAVIDATDKIENHALSVSEPHTDTATLTIPSASSRAGKVLSFDGDGNVSATDAGSGTISSITAGTGLSGGTITSSGTIAIDSTVATLTGSQTLTNKTLTSPVIDTGVSGTAIKDEDDMSSNSATALATQQSIKAFVDNQTLSLIDEDDMSTNSNTRPPSQQSVKAYADTKAELTGSTNNTITTVTGANAIQGEANLTFDGSTLAVTGAATVSTTLGVTGASTLDGVTVTDNTISTNASNADLELTGNSSGSVKINGLKFPTSDGTANHVLKTDGSGNLSFTENTGSSTGDISFVGSTISSPSNADITLDPGGTGRVILSPSTSVQVASGNFSVNAGYIENEGIRIDDNKISTTRSNDNLILDPAGTGVIQVNSNIDLNGLKITGGSTAAPLADGDLANKKYIDDSMASIGTDSISTSNNRVITDSNSVKVQIANGDEITVTDGHVRIHNDLTVDGTTTTINTTNTSIEDPILELSRNNSGPADIDSGIMINRGAANNAALYWDEGNDTFKAVTTTSAGNATSITDTLFADLQVKDLTAASLALSTDLAVANGGTGASSLTDNAVLTGTGTNPITAEGNLTFDGSTLAVTGAATISTTLGVTGASTLDGVTITDNTISTNASNANLEINANGSGTVNLENLKIGTSGATVTSILDEDTLSSNSATGLATQQSIKAYVDTEVAAVPTPSLITAGNSNVTVADSGTGSITVTTDGNTVATFTDAAGLTMSKNIAMGGFQITGIDTSSFPSADGDVATKKYVDDNAGSNAVTALNNATANELVTVGATTTELDAESNLTFDGSTLAVTGGITTTTSIANDAITLNDNNITASRSNDNLNLGANGTGAVVMSGSGSAYAVDNGTRNVMHHSNLSQAFGNKVYANIIRNEIKIDSSASDSSSSNDRYRNILEVELDLNGKDSTASNSVISRGPTNLVGVDLKNSSSGDSTLGNASANNNYIYAETSSTGDLTINVAASNSASIEASANTGSTITYADARVYNSNAQAGGGGGTDAITNLYHFKANSAGGFNVTNEFGFHSPDDMKSLIGGVTLLNGNITHTGNITTTGNISSTGTIGNDAISLDDNCIKTIRSNDDLYFNVSGQGQIVLAANGGVFDNYSTQSRYHNANILLYSNLNDTLGDDRNYRNIIAQDIKLAGSQNSSSSNDRWRNQAFVALDMNGSSATATSSAYRSRGPMGFEATAVIDNSTSTAVTLGNASGGNYGVSVYPTGTGNITLTAPTGMGVYFEVASKQGDIAVTDWVSFESIGFDRYDTTGGSGGDVTIGDIYHFRAGASTVSGSGSITITDAYGFYYENDTNVTNQYAFYSTSDTAKSRVGTLERYRETINTLTSSSTITVDCGLGPIHKVTLATNTGFVISNLGTGQSVTLIITQDGTGSRTATFGTDGSTAVKFSGGAPTLSTAASAIDVVTIFNDGTNFLGNIAKAYAA